MTTATTSRRRPRRTSRRNRSRFPASPPATRRCAPSGAPATICIIAATTSSTSPSTCEFEEIAHLLVHGKLPTRPSSTPTSRSSQRCAAFQRRCSVVLETDPRRARIRWTSCARRASALGSVLPEKDDHNARGRARHRRPPDGLVRLDAALLAPLQPVAARASRSRPTTIRSAGISCTCCIGAQAAGASWVRRCTRRSSSTPSTSSTPRRSPRA